MQSIIVFFDIVKFAEFRRKNADVSRARGEGVCHVIYRYFGCSLRKLLLCQVSSL